MNREALTTLADRAESAGAEEQGKLIEEGWRLINPEPAPPADARDYGCAWWYWKDALDKLEGMIHADAFESAVRILSPKGWDYEIMRAGPWYTVVMWPVGCRGVCDVRVSAENTEALAFLAAICRAVAQGEG